MVPAYDDPILWSGHSSMVHEIHKQLQKEPDAIFCSVGGGGLLGGIILGCKDVGWEHGTRYERFLQKSYFKIQGQFQLLHSKRLARIASTNQWPSTMEGLIAWRKTCLME